MKQNDEELWIDIMLEKLRKSGALGRLVFVILLPVLVIVWFGSGAPIWLSIYYFIREGRVPERYWTRD